jgi:hypothetical protein
MTTARDLAPQIRRQRQGTARYELHGNLAADLSEQLLTLHPPTSSRRFVCYPLSGTGRFADLGRTVELEVFGETFGNDRAEMEQEYGPYEDASRFFVVMDQRRRRPAGVLRVIGNSAVGLKTLRDIAGEPLRISQAEVQARHAVADLDRCWDVGTLAVRPEYRRSATRRRTVSLLLYRALFVHALWEGVEHFVTAMDRHAHRSLLALGVPFVPVCDSEPFDYIGSPCTALHGYVPEFRAKAEAHYRRMRACHPLAWCLLSGPMRKLMRGHGLDGRLQPPVD